MKIWEDRAIELMKQDISELDILDMLQTEMAKVGIFSGDNFVSYRVNMAQQIINNVKDK